MTTKEFLRGLFGNFVNEHGKALGAPTIPKPPPPMTKELVQPEPGPASISERLEGFFRDLEKVCPHRAKAIFVQQEFEVLAADYATQVEPRYEAAFDSLVKEVRAALQSAIVNAKTREELAAAQVHTEINRIKPPMPYTLYGSDDTSDPDGDATRQP